MQDRNPHHRQRVAPPVCRNQGRTKAGYYPIDWAGSGGGAVSRVCYAELDLQLVRTFRPEWEIAGQPTVPPHEVQRGVYFKVTKRY